jgi:hypothetical protein
MKTNINYNRKIAAIKKVTIIITVLGVFIACKKNGNDSSTPGDCSGPAKSFMHDVNPVVQASCATNPGCHAAGSVNGPGELTSYSKIFNARSDIRSEVASGEMPLGGHLSTAEKNAILCWIDNGAPNN